MHLLFITIIQYLWESYFEHLVTSLRDSYKVDFTIDLDAVGKGMT